MAANRHAVRSRALLDGGKVCSRCGDWKILRDFSPRTERGPGHFETRCKTCMSKRSIRYHARHPEQHLARARAWNAANPARQRQNAARSYARRRNEINAAARVRKRTDIQFRLRVSIRKRLSGLLRAGSPIEQLGCSVAELKKHLERQFVSGMSWENHGLHGWHIDHRVPLARFDLTDPAQFARACHFTNLQPLWAHVNLTKGAKLHVVE